MVPGPIFIGAFPDPLAISADGRNGAGGAPGLRASPGARPQARREVTRLRLPGACHPPLFTRVLGGWRRLRRPAWRRCDDPDALDGEGRRFRRLLPPRGDPQGRHDPDQHPEELRHRETEQGGSKRTPAKALPSPLKQEEDWDRRDQPDPGDEQHADEDQTAGSRRLRCRLGAFLADDAEDHPQAKKELRNEDQGGCHIS
jgi:hypothetical protein